MPTTALQPGMSGSAVQQLQQWLISQGYSIPDGATGYYGDQTKAAVLAFQKSHGVDYSNGPGFWGPRTIAAAQSPQTTQTTQNAFDNASTIASTQPPTSVGVAPAHKVTDPGQVAQFSGSGALVTLSGQGFTPNQLFYIDTSTKQLIPFSSMQSAMNYFGASAEDINSRTTEIPSAALNQGSSLSGYTVVPTANGFDESGNLSNPATSMANIQERYGRGVDQNAEVKAYTALDGFSKLLSSGAAGESAVSSSQIHKLISDPSVMGYYINALAYGGYSLQDVYQDMVRRQYIDKGKGSQVSGANPISMAQPASVYKASSAYQAVQSNPALRVTPTIAGIDSSILNLPVFQLPDEAFKLIAPLNNPDSPEFRSLMEQYKSATYEVALEIAQATNESEHAKAMNDWQTLRTDIQNRLGITLSDNAIQAWNQLESFTAQAGAANLSGSGVVQQKIDKYLKQQMGANKTMRKQYSSYEDQAKQSYYQNYASPTEIKDLIATDPVKAKAWGLIPDDKTKQYMTLGNLKKLFPDTPDEDLQAMIDKYVDRDGNFYSKLYGNYAATKYDIGGQAKVAEATKVMQSSQNDAQKALSQYSDPNNPFLKPEVNSLAEPKPYSLPTAPKTTVKVPQTKTPAQTPVTTTPSSSKTSIGSYRGTPIYAGSDTEIQAQVSAINAGPSTTSTAPKTTTATTTPIAPKMTTTPTTSTSGSSYVIKSGDTLGALAKKFGTTVTKLASLNNIADPNKIYAGSTLKY